MERFHGRSEIFRLTSRVAEILKLERSCRKIVPCSEFSEVLDCDQEQWQVLGREGGWLAPNNLITLMVAQTFLAKHSFEMSVAGP